MVETVKYRTYVLEQGIVVWLERACSGHDRRLGAYRADSVGIVAGPRAASGPP
jgi:hypothetical protein